MRLKRRIIGLMATGSLVAVLATLSMVLPVDIPATDGNCFTLVKPAFAQQSTVFPSDEAGISAYVNVGQNIDLAKAKNAMRGIQAEGSNYVIGIMELPGLPEEAFPHIYVSSDGWILAYYSKFAPSSWIFQWYGYEGGTISTTTLQNAIAKICSIIGANFNQAKGNMSYYHFKYPEATKLLMAIELITTKGGDWTVDTFTFSIPYDVTLYEGSWAHYYFTMDGSLNNEVYIDGNQVRDKGAWSGMASEELVCEYFEEVHTSPGKLHTVELRAYGLEEDDGEKTGVAAVFIYQ